MLKDNPWIISLVALIISLVSAGFVVVDKMKAWKDNSRIKKLKKDKALLFPLLNVSIENYHSVDVTKDGTNERTTLRPHFSKLYFVFQNINHQALFNQELAAKIKAIKEMDAGDLFESNAAPNTVRHTVVFTQPVIDVLTQTRHYLAEVI